MPVKLLILILGMFNWIMMDSSNWKITSVGLLCAFIFALLFFEGEEHAIK